MTAQEIIKTLNDVIVGDFIIAATGEEDFISLTDSQVEGRTERMRIL